MTIAPVKFRILYNKYTMKYKVQEKAWWGWKNFHCYRYDMMLDKTFSTFHEAEEFVANLKAQVFNHYLPYHDYE